MATCRSTACPFIPPSSPSIILCFSPPCPVDLSCNFNPTFHGAAARLQLAAGLRGRRKIRHAGARSDLSKGHDQQPSSSDEAIHTCGPFSLLGRSRIMEGDGDQATLGRPSSQEDWRGFRARLCREHDSADGAQQVSRNWAHEIAAPEEGCVLVATERLDGHPLLRRSVVLLTESREWEGGQGCWRGLAMNKRLPYAAGDMESVDAGVAIGLAECPAFVGGGPLLTGSASSFHIVTSLPLYGHRAVLPGLCVGTGDTALLAAWEGIRQKVVLPDQLHVHLGHLHWDARALSIEIAVLEWWRLTSCSASFLLEDNVDCIWGTLRSLL